MCSAETFFGGICRFFARRSRRRGLLLLEAMLLISGLAVIVGIALPLFLSWRDERLLDSAAAEAAAVIRQVQAEARNDETAYPKAEDGKKKLFFTMKNGQVWYYAARSTKNVKPSGYLPKGIIIPSNTTLAMEFLRKGFPVSKSETHAYSFQLMTADKKHSRRIIIAAYTGRVRIEKVR